MVLTDFSFLREHENVALVAAEKKLAPSPVVHLTMDPADDDWAFESPVKPEIPTATAVAVVVPPDNARSLCLRQTARIKSYSESGPVLEKMAALTVPRARKARPYSTGDIEDLRRVSISGFSKNKSGTWMFKVDVGHDGLDSYAVRRRFSDFRELYDGLQEIVHADSLPELPHHGLYSVMQLFFSPEPALSLRAKKLEELLQFVNKHPMLSTSLPFKKFLGKNPSSPDVGYVSLSCYEAPTSDSSFRLSSTRGYTRSRRQSS